MPPELPPDSAEHVRRAQQLLDKGLPERADFELERVDPRFGLHPEVLEARIAFHVCLRRVEAAAELAGVFERCYPERKGVLLRMEKRFPGSSERKGSIWDTFKPVG